jgi:ubiquinone/menaquinone biosynthesis C-methylase UbiE
MQRFWVGLHGLGLLREWPFGDPAEADARMNAIRRALAGDVDADADEVRDIDVLDWSEAYASWAPTYDEPNPLIAAEEASVLKALSILPAGVAVDAGTGTGRMAGHLARLGHVVFGVDRDGSMLRRAVDKGVRARFVRGDISRLPIRTSGADVATCALSLTHVSDLNDAFAELARVVRPGGAVVVSDIHPFAVATGAHAFFKRPDGSRAVARNEVHWPSAYVKAAVGAGLVVELCDEVLIDDALVEEFAIADDYLAETALLGLPFAIVWLFRRLDPRTSSHGRRGASA